MKRLRLLKPILTMFCMACFATIVRADYTGGLIAQWNFSTGTSADLTSDIGGYTLAVAGTGAPTYSVGSVSVTDGTELIATGINSTAVPSLTTNATVWVKMQFNSFTTNNHPQFFFGLVNATGPADWNQMSMAGMQDDWGNGTRLGVYANTTTGAYGTPFALPPATNTTFTMALVFQAGYDQNGYPNSALTEFEVYINGSFIGSGSASGTVVDSMAFALGTLKASGGEDYTFEQARVYDKALTAAQIAQIGIPATNVDGLIAQWNFKTGTSADLTSDIGGYTLAVAGTGAPTYSVGSVSIPAGTELIALGINSTAVPSLTTNATVWVSMQLNSVPVQNPVFFFGLVNAVGPADWDQMTAAGMQADWGSGSMLGEYANTSLGPPYGNYGNVLVVPPALNTNFTMALVLNEGYDAGGNPNPTNTQFLTYYNGALVGSGAATGTNVTIQAFGLGTLKASGGADYTFNQVRVYNQALTAAQIAQIGQTPVPVFTSVRNIGSAIAMSGTNGLPNGPFQLLTSTNLMLPVSSWSVVSTNAFDANGAFSVTNAVDPLKKGAFFLIKQ